jgi:acyl-CoA reductase-like NAD-dependent aldehyde dehydrogenase
MTFGLLEHATGTSARIEVTNPYSGNRVGEVPMTPAETIADATLQARHAWSAFRFSTPHERRQLLHALADEVRADAENLAHIICGEVGKTIAEARNEVRRAQNTLRLSGDGATVLHGEIISCAVVPGSPDKRAFITQEPAGVIAAITPFNYPLNLLCHKLGPAIAAGNAVTAKPSFKAPLAAALLAELATTTGFPDGLFQTVHGGAEAALSLARSEIGILSFTGSPAAGLALTNAAGLVRCMMDLGGNDPLIVMPDAELDRAADTALAHRFEIAGQSCAAAKKIYIHKAVSDVIFDKIRKRVEAVRTGDPFLQVTDMGPVIDEAAAIEVERRIRAAAAAGAELVYGGTRDNAMSPRRCCETFRSRPISSGSRPSARCLPPAPSPAAPNLSIPLTARPMASRPASSPTIMRWYDGSGASCGSRGDNKRETIFPRRERSFRWDQDQRHWTRGHPLHHPRNGRG